MNSAGKPTQTADGDVSRMVTDGAIDWGRLQEGFVPLGELSTIGINSGS